MTAQKTNYQKHPELTRTPDDQWCTEHAELWKSTEHYVEVGQKVFQAQGEHLPNAIPMARDGAPLTIMGGDSLARACEIINQVFVPNCSLFAVLFTGEIWMHVAPRNSTNGHIEQRRSVEALMYCLQCRDGVEIAWTQFINRDQNGHARLVDEILQIPRSILKTCRQPINWDANLSRT